MYGKTIRLKRLIPEDDKICIVPIDHALTCGPIDGMQDCSNLIGELIGGGVDALVIHKGLIRVLMTHERFQDCRYFLHLSASTNLGSDSSRKVLVSSVEEAVRFGMDGVSIHINLGCLTEPEMLRDFGYTACLCEQWGIPLLAMINSEGDANDYKLMHGVRIAQELGADIVKIKYPASPESVSSIINCVNIPVVVAGGSKMCDPHMLFEMVDNSIKGGAAGVAIGRNIFQYKDIKLMANLVSSLVHGDLNVADCVRQLDILGDTYE